MLIRGEIYEQNRNRQRGRRDRKNREPIRNDIWIVAVYWMQSKSRDLRGSGGNSMRPDIEHISDEELQALSLDIIWGDEARSEMGARDMDRRRQ